MPKENITGLCGALASNLTWPCLFQHIMRPCTQRIECLHCCCGGLDWGTFHGRWFTVIFGVLLLRIFHIERTPNHKNVLVLCTIVLTDAWFWEIHILRVFVVIWQQTHICQSVIVGANKQGKHLIIPNMTYKNTANQKKERGNRIRSQPLFPLVCFYSLYLATKTIALLVCC